MCENYFSRQNIHSFKIWINLKKYLYGFLWGSPHILFTTTIEESVCAHSVVDFTFDGIHVSDLYFLIGLSPFSLSHGVWPLQIFIYGIYTRVTTQNLLEFMPFLGTNVACYILYDLVTSVPWYRHWGVIYVKFFTYFVATSKLISARQTSMSLNILVWLDFLRWYECTLNFVTEVHFSIMIRYDHWFLWILFQIGWALVINRGLLHCFLPDLSNFNYQNWLLDLEVWRRSYLARGWRWNPSSYWDYFAI